MPDKSREAFVEDFLKRIHSFSKKISKEYFEIVASEMRKTTLSDWNTKDILTLHISALSEMVKDIIAVASCVYTDSSLADKKKIALMFMRGYVGSLQLSDFIADVINTVETIEKDNQAKENETKN